MKSKRVYFGGKIDFLDWRHDLFGRRVGGADDADYADRLLNPEHTEDVGGGVIYGGPFFVSDRHGCIDGLHGAGEPCGAAGKLRAWGMDVVTSTGRPITRDDIYRVNCARIQRADWVFAYVDAFTAYGTFFEIGYAVAHAIPVALTFSPDLGKHGPTAELWMIEKAATHRYHGLPKEAFRQFCCDVGLSWQATHEENNR